MSDRIRVSDRISVLEWLCSRFRQRRRGDEDGYRGGLSLVVRGVLPSVRLIFSFPVRAIGFSGRKCLNGFPGLARDMENVKFASVKVASGFRTNLVKHITTNRNELIIRLKPVSPDLLPRPFRRHANRNRRNACALPYPRHSPEPRTRNPTLGLRPRRIPLRPGNRSLTRAIQFRPRQMQLYGVVVRGADSSGSGGELRFYDAAADESGGGGGGFV